MNSTRTTRITQPLARWFGIMLWLTVIGLDVTPCEAQSATSKEYKVKAAFLFNFAQFVTWPTNTFAELQTPLVIGVIGDDPFGPALDEMVRGENVSGHPLIIQRYRKIEEIKMCHILFINESGGKQLEELFVKLKGRSILTVSDTEEFSKKGGMIRFFKENSKIRLRINVAATKQANLEVASKLLRLAEVVSLKPTE